MFYLASTLLTLVATLSSVDAQLVSCTTIHDIVCNDPGYTSLCAAIDEAGLGETLSSGSWTLFAPNDQAFEGFFEDLDVNLDTVPMEVLMEVLLLHVVENEYTSTDLADRCSDLLEMASGEETRTICKDGNIYQKGAGNADEDHPMVTLADVKTCNGIVHAVDGVISPFSLRESADENSSDNDGDGEDNENGEEEGSSGDYPENDNSDADESDGDSNNDEDTDSSDNNDPPGGEEDSNVNNSENASGDNSDGDDSGGDFNNDEDTDSSDNNNSEENDWDNNDQDDSDNNDGDEEEDNGSEED